MPINKDLVERIKGSYPTEDVTIGNIGNPVVRILELEKQVRDQQERISELEKMVIRLSNIVQREYMAKMA